MNQLRPSRLATCWVVLTAYVALRSEWWHVYRGRQGGCTGRDQRRSSAWAQSVRLRSVSPGVPPTLLICSGGHHVRSLPSDCPSVCVPRPAGVSLPGVLLSLDRSPAPVSRVLLPVTQRLYKVITLSGKKNCSYKMCELCPPPFRILGTWRSLLVSRCICFFLTKTHYVVL